jgi:hypothetical protein
LLFLRANRHRRAWWIWAPLALAAAGVSLGAWAIHALPEALPEVLPRLYLWLAAALAIVWLLAPHLTSRSRVTTFLAVLLTVALTFLAGLATFPIVETGKLGLTPFAILAAILAFILTLTIALTGLCCHGRYGVVRLLVWFAVWSVVTHALAGMPFFLVFAWNAGAGKAQMLDFWLAVGGLGLVTFLVALPFLLLAAGERFYRQRLSGLMKSAPALEEAQSDSESSEY